MAILDVDSLSSGDGGDHDSIRAIFEALHALRAIVGIHSSIVAENLRH
jgi:hypothetical protein